MSSDAPSYVKSTDGFTFYNTYEKKLIEPEKTEPCSSPSTAIICESVNSTQHHANYFKADLSDPGSQPRQLDFFLLGY